MNLKYELQRIISGVGKDSAGDLIKAAAHNLREGKETGRYSQEIEYSKNQEATQLVDWIEKSDLWFNDVDESRFIARGAEQRVYLDKDARYVINLMTPFFMLFGLITFTVS